MKESASMRRTLVIIHDLVMVSIAWALAVLVRADIFIQTHGWIGLVKGLPVILLAQGIVLWWLGLYRGLWRFASIRDVWNIFLGAVFGTLAVTLAVALTTRLEGVPRTSLLLYPMFLVFLLGAPRLFYRMWKDNALGFGGAGEGTAERVLLVGAGQAGEMLSRDILRNRDFLAVGFLDDEPRLSGAKVHGVPVLGTISDLPKVVSECEIDLVMIAMPSANSQQMRRVVQQCEKAGVQFRTLPMIGDLMTGRVTVNELREVCIEDLLGRDPVRLDWAAITHAIVGKTVLITGGGGSIGAELCRQVAGLAPARLVILDNGEFNLYRIEMEIGERFRSLDLSCHLGSVTDAIMVERVVAQHKPQIVFHAAAYKHVPMLEKQVRAAIANNVLGTKIMADAADRHGVESFILISTDKAVNPTNVMGATKRAAEIYCQHVNRGSKTRFVTVRFGNVLGSDGSVVPLFRKQIESGGPVTVTHPEIERYFMTIPEACQLILQSGAMGIGGEIFVLDMGEPVKIRYLAEQMIRLSGKIPGEDIEIIYTGLRPGEKMFEELFHAQEQLVGTGHEKIFLSRHRDVDWQQLDDMYGALESACRGGDETRLLHVMNRLVPEFVCGPCMPKPPQLTHSDKVLALPTGRG